jgi:hypothetical protein
MTDLLGGTTKIDNGIKAVFDQIGDGDLSSVILLLLLAQHASGRLGRVERGNSGGGKQGGGRHTLLPHPAQNRRPGRPLMGMTRGYKYSRRSYQSRGFQNYTVYSIKDHSERFAMGLDRVSERFLFDPRLWKSSRHCSNTGTHGQESCSSEILSMGVLVLHFPCTI